MDKLEELNQQAQRLANIDRMERRVYEALEKIGKADQVVDILTGQTRYVHHSLPDGRTLIFDISGVDMAATKPNADHTLTIMQDGQVFKLEPINGNLLDMDRPAK